MRSQHADTFNHDEDAADYDADVVNEDDPIRTGYASCLEWLAKQVRTAKPRRILELGSGTGNLTRLLPESSEIVCVDVSSKMEAIASSKLPTTLNRRFIKEDVLAAFDHDIGTFDCILSSYTLHHLTEDEKALLHTLVWERLNANGLYLVGDLMIASEDEVHSKISGYQQSGDTDTALAIEEEFFWRIDTAKRTLEDAGFSFRFKSFSDLSHGFAARKHVP